MRNLIIFLVKNNHWFLFIFLELLSWVLIFQFNHFQQGAFFSTANVCAGKVYELTSGVTGYFQLKSVNKKLMERNVRLEQQNNDLNEAMKALVADSVWPHVLENMKSTARVQCQARVIKNSLNQADNYITLNKGTRDGVQQEMGVVDGNGVIGIVYKASSSYAVVISLLNSKSNISCKIRGSDYFGYLKWEYGDSQYAYLVDLPRHAEFSLGDTVVTSGFSTVFPEGVMVGTVANMRDSNDGLSYLLKVKLASDFGCLGDVSVIAREGKEEQVKLEKTIKP